MSMGDVPARNRGGWDPLWETPVKHKDDYDPGRWWLKRSPAPGNPDTGYAALNDRHSLIIDGHEVASWTPNKLDRPKWAVEVVPEFALSTPGHFNWFHRLMSRLLLGWKWTRLPLTQTEPPQHYGGGYSLGGGR